MLVSERVFELSQRVGDLANRAYGCAPALVQDLRSVLLDLRSLYEAVTELEPSRSDLHRLEARLYRYPSLVALLTQGDEAWWARAYWLDYPTSTPCDERIQGGTSVALAQRIAEEKDALERKIQQRLDFARQEVDNIRDALLELPSRMEALIRLRYFEGKCWYDIADELGCARSHCFRLRDEALTYLSSLLDML